MVLVVLFPLPDEKNVDVKTIFTCSQTCLLEMNPRVLALHRIETRIASRQATALDNEKPAAIAAQGVGAGRGRGVVVLSPTQVLALEQVCCGEVGAAHDADEVPEQVAALLLNGGDVHIGWLGCL